MREFTQAVHESVLINHDISVTVLEIRGDEVILGIDAPDWMMVEDRAALAEAVGGMEATLSTFAARPR